MTGVTEADVAAVSEALESGWLTMGPRTQAFEAALAEYLGAPHVVTVSSGAAALHLACIAAGVGPGDEVIVPSLGSVAAPNAVRYTGATPVFCDAIGAREPVLDPADVIRRTGPATRAVIAVHLWGYPAPLAALREHCDANDVALIEDAAQAIGAAGDDGVAGTAGALGCLSFDAATPLGVGEGGAIVTADEDKAKRVRLLRSHAMTTVTWDRHRGYAESYDVMDVGFNYRLDEPRSALGHSRLKRLDAEIGTRRAAARAYRAELGELELPWSAAADELASPFRFAILLPDRAARDGLRDRVPGATAHEAIHRTTEYREPGRSLPVTEDVADRHLLLPVGGSTDAGEVVRLVRAAL